MNLGQNDGPNEKKPGGPDRPKNNFWTPLVIALALVLCKRLKKAIRL